MAAVRNVGVRGTPVVEEEAATVAASRVAAPGAVMVVVSSFAALPHLVGGGASVCFLWAREGATLFLAASNDRFVVSEDALAVARARGQRGNWQELKS